MIPYVKQPPNWDSARDTDPYYVDPEDEAKWEDPGWDEDDIPVNVDGEIDADED